MVIGHEQTIQMATHIVQGHAIISYCKRIVQEYTTIKTFYFQYK